MEKIQFMPEGEDHPVDFFVLGATKLAGRQYLLVTDSEDGDGEALILRREEENLVRTTNPEEETEKSGRSGDGEQEDASYKIIEDETELSAVLLLMRDSLEEIGIEVEL